MADIGRDEFETYLAFAHRLADATEETVLRYFRSEYSVEDKSDGDGYDPVTAADREVEEVIRAEIAAAWPEHAVAGEEFGGDVSDAEFCWIIDPIDGTRPFIAGLPTWGTLIGLSRDGKPLLGLMNQPYTGERFWSGRDTAHYRNRDGEQIISTRACSTLGNALLTTPSPDLFATADDKERFDILSEQVRMRLFGGDCYAYCLLAAGHIDLIVESGLAPYDIAPLIPIIERAGGCVTSWDGGAAAQGGHAVACGDRDLRDDVLKVLRG
ncbi:MAG: histidinol-phosphatase [Hyphomicrobiaceae bacterium]|nr:histidinol-phosphatase [Hyphomicrobiaceae bacterium]